VETREVSEKKQGCLLDSEQGAALCKFAEENTCQVWLEQVSRDKDVGIVIEDGHLREAAANA
jgi:hypothetical protein